MHSRSDTGLQTLFTAAETEARQTKRARAFVVKAVAEGFRACHFERCFRPTLLSPESQEAYDPTSLSFSRSLVNRSVRASRALLLRLATWISAVQACVTSARRFPRSSRSKVDPWKLVKWKSRRRTSWRLASCMVYRKIFCGHDLV